MAKGSDFESFPAGATAALVIEASEDQSNKQLMKGLEAEALEQQTAEPEQLTLFDATEFDAESVGATDEVLPPAGSELLYPDGAGPNWWEGEAPEAPSTQSPQEDSGPGSQGNPFSAEFLAEVDNRAQSGIEGVIETGSLPESPGKWYVPDPSKEASPNAVTEKTEAENGVDAPVSDQSPIDGSELVVNKMPRLTLAEYNALQAENSAAVNTSEEAQSEDSEGSVGAYRKPDTFDLTKSAADKSEGMADAVASAGEVIKNFADNIAERLNSVAERLDRFVEKGETPTDIARRVGRNALNSMNERRRELTDKMAEAHRAQILEDKQFLAEKANLARKSIGARLRDYANPAKRGIARAHNGAEGVARKSAEAILSITEPARKVGNFVAKHSLMYAGVAKQRHQINKFNKATKVVQKNNYQVVKN